MSKNWFFHLVLTGLFSSSVMAANFEGVDQFDAVELRGDLHVYCSEGVERDSAYHYCQELILEPAEAAYFTAGKVDADEVELRATWPSGKVVEKDVGYDAEEGRSDKRVNLWIKTLFQRPLLTIGANRIEYKLKKNGRVQQEGSLVVRVSEGEARTCPYRTMSSSSLRDCRTSFSVCQRYFWQNNDCR